MAVITITKDNFESEIINSKVPVIADFWASWCAPCRMVAPILDEIASENDDIKVCKINVDDEKELAEKFQIMTIPTLLIFKDGEMVNKSVGVKPKEAILDLV